jgi:hypothetical protein
VGFCFEEIALCSILAARRLTRMKGKRNLCFLNNRHADVGSLEKETTHGMDKSRIRRDIAELRNQLVRERSALNFIDAPENPRLRCRGRVPAVELRVPELSRAPGGKFSG